MSSWVSYHFEHLRRWREYAEKVARAARDVVGDVKVYAVGGVAEERTTIYSDIDLLIILRGGGLKEKKKLYRKILERAIDVYGLPWDAPVELHIVDEREAEEYLKLSKKIVKIIPERLQNHYQPSKRT